MDAKRRDLLKAGGLALAAALIAPRAGFAQDWNKAIFDAKGFGDALKALGGGGSTESSEILIGAPDIAENGAIVPISIATTLKGVKAIAIVVDKNPNALAASFAIPAGTDPFVSTRVKMAETSNVYALVNAGGKYFHAVKEVKVTLGGCGG